MKKMAITFKTIIGIIFIGIVFSCKTKFFHTKDSYMMDIEILKLSVKIKEKIRKNEKNIKARFSLQNITTEKVLILTPLYYNTAVKPIMKNEFGDTLTFKLGTPKRDFSRRMMTIINSGETYEEEFEFNLDECYDLSKEGRYEFYFIYLEQIFNEEKNLIISESKLYSNTIAFEVL